MQTTNDNNNYETLTGILQVGHLFEGNSKEAHGYCLVCWFGCLCFGLCRVCCVVPFCFMTTTHIMQEGERLGAYHSSEISRIRCALEKRSWKKIGEARKIQKDCQRLNVLPSTPWSTFRDFWKVNLSRQHTSTHTYIILLLLYYYYYYYLDFSINSAGL